ncbi:transcriptional regulator [Methanobrevibacter arboriphilus JCM 13429 = DSM 1125]|uniref:Transcriptional regulator n=1 Tax=Methanobrevibacter arboriphilus JCM 13429 = DSM 1125 TaxID=1300164 RepID=A0A1V6N0Y5_METAZ|nr:MarR family transcriptional regulator [Methanobrevibacter arboriphilus]OQD58186.1 transcriptional regulator [Methanobrevibacter arboriphilus JCM 13429 = DSM 1125]
MCLNNDYVDLDNSYGYVLATILHKFGEKFDEALKDYSIVTNHYRVLVTIFNNEKINQKKLGEILKIDRTTMVYLIDHLEDEGYIRRQKNQEDRRSFQLILTSKGKSIINPICRIRDEIHNQCLKELTENEKRILREICKKIGDD